MLVLRGAAVLTRGYMKNSTKVRDIMTAQVVTLRESDSLAEAWKILSKHHVSGAPVLDDNEDLVGVISQTDLMREAYGEAFRGFAKESYFMSMPVVDETYWPISDNTLHTTTVEEAMNPDVITAKADDDVALLAAMMRHHHIHRVIVTDNSKVAGIVSSLDLLALLEDN